MTKRLYETDSYCKEFQATVLSCDQVGATYHIVLDQTAFFPEGGGQAADLGRINDVEVTDVQLEGDIIVHKTAAPLPVGQTVLGKIDWPLRFARMQSHAGEHVVSGLVHREFGYTNVGFHMSEALMTADFDGPLTAEDVAMIEQRANEVIYQNRAITVEFPSPEELKTLEYRSKLDLESGVRLVYIEGTDCCACCAPHPATTGEIGIIKITDFYPNKGGTRVEMLAGIRALEDYVALHQANKVMMKELSASRFEVPEVLRKEHRALMEVRSENNRLAQQLALLSMERVALGSSLCGFTEGAGFDQLRYCVNNLAEEYGEHCVLFSKNEEGWFYTVGSKTDGRSVVSALNSTFSGKGGGKPNCAQGKIGPASKEELLALLKTLM